MMTRLAPAVLAGSLMLAIAACASSERLDPDAPVEAAGDAVRVHVNNDLVPGRTVVVWMVPETGSRRRLGSIPPNGQQTFTYAPTARSMEHQLVAELEGGGRQSSRGFSLEGVATIRWQVSGPTVTVGR